MSCSLHDASVNGEVLLCLRCGATGVRKVQGSAVVYEWQDPPARVGVSDPEGTISFLKRFNDAYRMQRLVDENGVVYEDPIRKVEPTMPAPPSFLPEGHQYRCQFCGESSPAIEWGEDGETCPKCGEVYDAVKAQEEETD